MRPSQRLNTYIDSIRDESVPHSTLILDLEQMRDQFQKEEAEAYRSLQAINEYYGVHAELKPSFYKLTGRKDD